MLRKASKAVLAHTLWSSYARLRTSRKPRPKIASSPNTAPPSLVVSRSRIAPSAAKINHKIRKPITPESMFPVSVAIGIWSSGGDIATTSPTQLVYRTNNRNELPVSISNTLNRYPFKSSKNSDSGSTLLTNK